MGALKGRDERSLDPKSRVIVPQRFRDRVESAGTLAPNPDGCIELWGKVEFEDEATRRLAAQDGSEESRHTARWWYSMCSDFTLDQQSRITVPPSLRQHAKMESPEVLFVGFGDRVELWSKQVWDDRVARYGSTGS